MAKKWHEDWVASDCFYKQKGTYFYATGKKQNTYWRGQRLGKAWEHEEIWNT
jgi:hypothetical protein